MKDLSNRVAIITGSSSGVGAATARLFASLGCNVVINYNANSEGASKVAASCEELGAGKGVETLIFGGSVAEDSACQAMVQAAIDKWGRVDILVNNAGTTKFVDHENLDGLDAEDFQRIYGVNVVGCYQMTRAVNQRLCHWLVFSHLRSGSMLYVRDSSKETGFARDLEMKNMKLCLSLKESIHL